MLQGAEAKYIQVKDILKEEIITGKWRPGDKLPTEKDLINRFEVSQATITGAMRELTSEGFVTRKRRLGTIVTSPEARLDAGRKGTVYLVGGGALDAQANPLNFHIPSQIYKGAINNTRQNVVLLDDREVASHEIAGQSESGVVFMNGVLAGGGVPAANIPWVAINRRSAQFTPVNAVNCDEVVSAYNGVTYLVGELGHRHVAAVWGGRLYHQDKLAGYRMALDVCHVPFRTDLVFESLGGKEAGYAAAKALMPKLPEVTAVYVDTDLKAMGLIDCLREHGVDVPGQVSVIGMDDIFRLSEDYGLTTVKVPFYEMGKSAVQLLQRRIASNGADMPSVQLYGAVVRRDTCAPWRGTE